MEDWRHSQVNKHIVQLIKATKCSERLIEKLSRNFISIVDDLKGISHLNDEHEQSKRLYEIIQEDRVLGIYDILQNSLKETGQDKALKILQDRGSNSCTVGKIKFDKKLTRGTGKLQSTEVFVGKFGRLPAEVAVKVLNPNPGGVDKTVALQKVVALVKLAVHENVARYYGVERKEDSVYIARELGFISLQEEVSLNLLNMDKFKVLNDCTKGLDHLHNKLNILHTNLKPSNVLLCHGGTVKIADFGLTKGNSDFAVAGRDGDWMPPEILEQLTEIEVVVADNEIEKMFTEEGDIFALGCIYFFTLTNGSHPFGKVSFRQYNIIQNISRLANSNVNEKWKELIRKLITGNPERRLLVQDVLKELTTINDVPDQEPTVDSQSESKPSLDEKAKQIKRKHIDDPDNDCKKPRSSSSSELNPGPKIANIRSLSTSSDNISLESDTVTGKESQLAIIHLPVVTNYQHSMIESQEPRLGPSSAMHQVVSLMSDQAFQKQTEGAETKLSGQSQEVAVISETTSRPGFRNRPSLNALRDQTEEGRKAADESGSALLIHQAITDGKSVDEIRDLVNQGVDWKLKNEYGSTALHEAATIGHIDAIRYLLSLDGEGATLEEKDVDKMTPLLCAASAEKNFLKIVQLLIESGADKNAVDGQEDSLLFLAVENRKQTLELEALIRKWEFKWEKLLNKDKEGIVHVAAKWGNLEALEYFISLRPDGNVDERDAHKKTPLHLAANLSNDRFFETVDLLTDHGAKINAVDYHGNNLLFEASFHGRSVADLNKLINLGVQWDRKSYVGENIVHFSAKGGNWEAVKYFISLGANLNDVDKYGQTPLLKVASAQKNISELLTAFKESSADFDAVGKKMENLVLLAVSEGRSRKDLEIMVKDFGVDWRAKNDCGQGVLHIAVKYGNTDAIDFFVGEGADVNERDKTKKKNKPINYAQAECGSGFAKTLTCLIRNGAKIDKRRDKVLLESLLNIIAFLMREEFVSQQQGQELKDLVHTKLLK